MLTEDKIHSYSCIRMVWGEEKRGEYWDGDEDEGGEGLGGGVCGRGREEGRRGRGGKGGG